MGPATLLLLLAAQVGRAAEAEWASAGIEIGTGLRISQSLMDDPHDFAEGPRAAVRVPLDPHGVFIIEGDLFVRTSGKEASDTVATLVQIAHQGDPYAGFQMPFQYDTLAASALMDWGLWARRGPHALMGGPRLLAGIEGRRIERVCATYDAGWGTGQSSSPVALSDPDTGYSITAVAGLALDLWFWQQVGLRAGWFHRLSVEPEPDHDPLDDTPLATIVTDRPVFTLDVLYRFGRAG